MVKAPPSLSAEQEAKARELAEHLSGAFASELLELARLLLSKDDRHAFGQTEFEVRQAVHRLGAKALEAALAQKKPTGAKPAGPGRGRRLDWAAQPEDDGWHGRRRGPSPPPTAPWCR